MASSDSTFGLAPLQESILLQALINPEPGTGLQQVVVRLPLCPNGAMVQRAWERVVARHPALRTKYRWEGLDESQQEVEEVASIPFREMDWAALPPAEQSLALAKFLEDDRVQEFCLGQVPLLRIALVSGGEDTAWLVCSVHSIVADRSSLCRVIQEVMAEYAGDGYQDANDAERAPFRDFVECLREKPAALSEEFWRQQMRDVGPATQLPRSQDGVPTGGPAIGHVQGQLSRDATEGLRALARKHGWELCAILEAAWALLLNRYTGESDILFGISRDLRPPECAATVGVFLNIVPLRTVVDPDCLVVDWVTHLQAHLSALRAHAHLPFTRIWKGDGRPRNIPLVESLVHFDEQPLGLPLPGRDASAPSYEVDFFERPGFPLVATIRNESCLLLRLTYERCHFDKVTVERIMCHWRNLLEAIAANPNQPIWQLPMLSAVENEQLTVERNLTGVAFPRGLTLHGWFERQVEHTPNAIAVSFEGAQLTYDELNRRANQLAHVLRHVGVGPEVLVGLFLDRSMDAVVGILGILKAGGAYLPLDPAYPQARLAFMLADAEVRFLLTQSSLLASLPEHQAVALCLDRDASLLDGEPQTNPSSAAAADHLAYVIYTSGSTGTPKGAMITHYNVVRLMQATEAWYRFNSKDVWTCFHSLAFDFSVWEIWGALLYGGRVIVVPYITSRSPVDFYRLLVHEGVTVLNQTPSAFKQLMQADERLGTADGLVLRYVIFGGEALDLPSLRGWFDRHGDASPQLVNMYGITETTVHVTYRPLSTADVTAGSMIGKPIPDLQVYLLDPHGQPVPMGVAGEMYVGGAGVARGYLKRPELTLEKFVVDPFSGRPGARLYRTGDLARFLPNLDIQYLGRNDDQVKIRGFRIELGEIESALRDHPIVRDCVVIPMPQDAEKRLVAYVVLRERLAPSIADLRAFLRARLANYMIPSWFVFLDRLPLTPNGKVNRRALPPPPAAPFEAPVDYVAPKNQLEEKIAHVWESVLKQPKVGTHGNFFDLGGTSLMIVQIHLRLQDLLQHELPISALFQFPTVSALASHLNGEAVAECHASDQAQDRAARQREALARRRPVERS